MKRVKNTPTGKVPDLTPREAMKLLRTKHLGENGLLPLYEAREVLFSAFPQCWTLDDQGERRVHYRQLLSAVLQEFVPAFQEGKLQGRPKLEDSGIVQRVTELMGTGEARSVKHACSILEQRRVFPEVQDVRSAYYREKRAT
jgi:hypothetical protein